MEYSCFYSFIVPCYNSEQTLRKCIVSIQKQTIADWEAICINDGSTDSTLAILREYANVDSRFSIINTTNGGVACARNMGLRAAKGKYIVFIDSDDWVEPDLISKCGNIDESDFGIYGHRFIRNGESVEENYSKDVNLPKNEHFRFVLDYHMMTNITSYACDKVFKREIIVENNLLLQDGVKIGEDLEFILRYLSHCKSICHITHILYNYNWGYGVTGNHCTIWKKISIDDWVLSMNILKHITPLYKSFNRRVPGAMAALLYWNLRHRSYIKSILSYAPILFRRKILLNDTFTFTDFVGDVSFMRILSLGFCFCVKTKFVDSINNLKKLIYRLIK